MSNRIYQLKIELDEIAPTIWRRFIVPSNISLDRLHDIIQIVMGWKDYHLHEFIIKNNIYTENPESPDEGKEENKFILEDLIKRKNTSFKYHYDFGDDWLHTVVVENINFNENIRFPLCCLEGARACPPEDVGGIYGYEDFCKSISDENDKNHKDMKEWYASIPWNKREFNSEEFDSELVTGEILKYMRWSRPRVQSCPYE
ncbi:MAG: plasmid pRiA4b ORF-3 family protein [Solidesulfovibrio sp.]